MFWFSKNILILLWLNAALQGPHRVTMMGLLKPISWLVAFPPGCGIIFTLFPSGSTTNRRGGVVS